MGVEEERGRRGERLGEGDGERREEPCVMLPSMYRAGGMQSRRHTV